MLQTVYFDPSVDRKMVALCSGEVMIKPPQGSASFAARLKLFPFGSRQCARADWCSLYLRMVGGCWVRFTFGVGPRLTQTESLECHYERSRDKGRHDMCAMRDLLASNGSVTLTCTVLDGGVE